MHTTNTHLDLRKIWLTGLALRGLGDAEPAVRIGWQIVGEKTIDPRTAELARG